LPRLFDCIARFFHLAAKAGHHVLLRFLIFFAQLSQFIFLLAREIETFGSARRKKAEHASRKPALARAGSRRGFIGREKQQRSRFDGNH